MSNTPDYVLIETANELSHFYEQNNTVEWLAFDTEFISEKRFNPQLCLIQVATEHGIFLIDSLKIEDLTPFLNLIQHPDILKITHAGENDYRIFYLLFDITPQNTFDTQIASGFLSYNYPISFKDLVGNSLKIKLDKTSKVSNWSKRPIPEKQLVYAIKDVLYLRDLYLILKENLEKEHRFDWVLEECKNLEDREAYHQDPFKELGKSRIFNQVNQREQIFLLRITKWRYEKAKEKNRSTKNIMDNKLMYEITKNIKHGNKGLNDHRIIPNWVVSKYGELFTEFYQTPATEEERALIQEYSQTITTTPQRAITMDLLTSLLKYKAMENNVSANLIISRNDLNQMKTSNSFFPAYLDKTWRKKLLGEAFIEWLKGRKNLKIELTDENCVISMEGGN